MCVYVYIYEIEITSILCPGMILASCVCLQVAPGHFFIASCHIVSKQQQCCHKGPGTKLKSRLGEAEKAPSKGGCKCQVQSR